MVESKNRMAKDKEEVAVVVTSTYHKWYDWKEVETSFRVGCVGQ